ncbi:MAG: histidinol dehydrogenase, partial [Acidobacteriota bacterium]|nr:histidinol dehydrogenase [Acidobacteriota bacterium]
MAFDPRIVESTNERAVAALLDRRVRRDGALDRRVSRIVERVRRDGDRAVAAYARQFDRLSEPIEVTSAEIRTAARRVPREVQRAIAMAARNIRRVAGRQVPRA